MVMATSDVASACADLQVVLSLAWCCVNCSALFVITLSEEEPRDGDELFHLVLHGNREVWADKSMNLVCTLMGHVPLEPCPRGSAHSSPCYAQQIVCKNGRTGFHGEHCATDGSVITRIMLVRTVVLCRLGCEGTTDRRACCWCRRVASLKR